MATEIKTWQIIDGKLTQLLLIPLQYPPTPDLSLVHLLGHSVDIFQRKLVRNQSVDLKVIKHCHINQPWYVDISGTH
jgi:hypothetical protein